MKKFKISTHTTIDKSFEILPPDNLDIQITIDYDDVDHKEVDKIARAIVKCLNNHIDELPA